MSGEVAAPAPAARRRAVRWAFGRPRPLLLAAGCLALAVLSVDLLTPADFTISFLYVPAVLLVSARGAVAEVRLATALACLLGLAGGLLGPLPAVESFAWMMANRILACATTVLVGMLLERALRLEAQRNLLVGELEHRARNMLAVLRAMLRLAPQEDARSLAAAMESRIDAMARAQALLTGGNWQAVSLEVLAQGELGRLAPGLVELRGPPVQLAPPQVQPMTMLLHELLTNALKHGALSVPGGRILLSWGLAPAGGRLDLRWQEQDGPPVAGAPGGSGFGSRLLQALARQLSGQLSLDWAPAGLSVTLSLPPERFTVGTGGSARR